MKINLKDIVIRCNFLLRCVKVYNNLTYAKAFEKLVKRKSELDIFDYKTIAVPLKRYYADFVPENNDKCMSICLKEYMGINTNTSIKAVIEHGLFFGDFVSHQERVINVPSIITYGRQRMEHLRNKDVKKNIIPIGPYIHYAKPFLSQSDFTKLKEKLGRVLLVFPSHSLASEGSIALYNIEEFETEIDKVANDYDTVLISLHYNDIGLGADYEKKGYKCVTSGHTNDPAFMRRQRTLIELADMTMSNTIGTHIGYCIYLNRPHYVFRQEVKRTMDKAIKEKTSSWRNWDIYEKEYNEVLSTFESCSPIITDEQRAVVNKYWGTEFVKSPEELKKLLCLSRL